MNGIDVWAFVHGASWKDKPMHAVIGQVKIKPDRADEALAMIGAGGIAMVQGMAGSAAGYWARSLAGDIPSGCSTQRKTRGQRRRPSSSSATCPMRQRRSSASTFARSSGTHRTAAESMWFWMV